MTTKEIVDTLLKLVEILTSWQVVMFFALVFFRREIGRILPEIGKRLTKAEIGGNKFEFSEIQKAAVNALPDAIQQGAKEFKDKPDELANFVREQVEKLPEFQESTSTNVQSNLIGRSILWVDDKPMNNVYESGILKQLGASILFARSTDEALTFLSRDNFDLIISDVHRNENGISNSNAGYELLESLEGTNRNLPVIFYTSSVGGVNKERTKYAFGIANTPSKVVDLAVRALKKN
jgi:CheY-like chemotaxis protein